MTQSLVTWLIGASALGCAVMAGVYFTFSAFVMRSLAELPIAQGIAAMQSINRVILGSIFMPLFFGTTALGCVFFVYGLVRSDLGVGDPLVWAGVVYVLGMFVVTAAGNVPLNDALHRISVVDDQAASLWQHYLRRWTMWNHLRMLASLVSSGLFVRALLV